MLNSLVARLVIVSDIMILNDAPFKRHGDLMSKNGEYRTYKIRISYYEVIISKASVTWFESYISIFIFPIASYIPN